MLSQLYNIQQTSYIYIKVSSHASGLQVHITINFYVQMWINYIYQNTDDRVIICIEAQHIVQLDSIETSNKLQLHSGNHSIRM